MNLLRSGRLRPCCSLWHAAHEIATLPQQLAKAQRKSEQVTVKAEVSNTPQVKDAIDDLVKKFGDPFAS